MTFRLRRGWGGNITLLQRRYEGDLRSLHAQAGGDVKKLAVLLQEFAGIGPSGAGIFLREAQAVWPDVRPYADKLVLKGAERAGLPTHVDALAQCVAPEQFANLAAALVRISRERHSRAKP